MGIPSMFRQIIKDHPTSHFWKDDMHVDNLLIDFNSIIYQVINILNEKLGINLNETSPVLYENQLIDGIIKQLHHVICEVIRPEKMVYIAMDGVPPRAKMIQQRARRYKILKEQNFKKDLEKKYKITIQTLQWNKSAISPGTSFMVKLSKLIIKNIKQKYFQIHNEKLTVIFSDDSIPGEGEHKLLPSIRKLKSNQETREDVTVIYSPDADLIILSIMSNVNKIYILREPKDSDIEILHYKNHEFLYLNIDVCREEFEKSISLSINGYAGSIHTNEILRDYSFLTFLCGNDFIIAAPFLKMKEGGIQLLIDSYIEVFNGLNITKPYQFLVDDTQQINVPFLIKLLKDLAIVEEDMLKKWQKKRDRVRQGSRSSKRESSEQDKTPWEIEIQRFNHEEYYSPLHPHFKFLNKVFNKIDYYSPDWNKQYNDHFFSDTVNMDDVCYEYFKSLSFCLKYYYEIPHWTWFYKYRAAPSINQFSTYLEKNIDKLNIVWEPSQPCAPFEQLMFILPRNSFKLLPKIITIEADFEEYYPKNFILDIMQGGKFIYSEAILPDIPIEKIKSYIDKIYSQLTNLEQERNTLRFKPYVHKIR